MLSALEGYGVELDAKVTVREVSLGGFSVESPVAFSVGSEQTFLFSTPDSRETMVRCVCRHTRATGTTGTTLCVAGFEFLPNQDANLQIIVNLYDRLRRRRPE